MKMIKLHNRAGSLDHDCAEKSKINIARNIIETLDVTYRDFYPNIILTSSTLARITVSTAKADYLSVLYSESTMIQ